MAKSEKLKIQKKGDKKKEKKWTEEEMRKLYEEDPALWLQIFSKGKYGKKPKKD